MALAPGGDIVLGGEVNPEPQPGLLGTLVGILSHNLGLGQEYMAARLSPDGTPDRSFGSDGVVTVPVGVKSVANGVAVEPNGDVVLGGSGFIGKNVVSATARLLPGGGLDPKFGTGGESIQVLAHGINAIATQPDGKLVLAGTGPTAIRLNADGSPDGTFGADGIDWIGNRAGNGANGVTFDRANGDIVLTGGATLSGRVELSVIRLHGT
jgi:uncharacterized delta-60 repeat protein